MTNLHIGECVTFRDRAYVVRGMSPMGAVLRRVQLEDVASGEHVEASVDDIEVPVLGNGRSALNPSSPSGGMNAPRSVWGAQSRFMLRRGTRG